MGRSFADPDTEFELVTSGTPLDVDGCKIGEPTGQVVCMTCHRVAENVDEIRHKRSCPQHDVHSEWWRRSHDDE